MNKQRLALLLIIILFFFSGSFAINGFTKSDDKDVRSKINLGLDLVGGSSLTLEADFDQYIQDMNATLIENLKTAFLNERVGAKVDKIGNDVQVIISAQQAQKFKDDKTIEKIAGKVGSYNISYKDGGQIIFHLNDSYLKNLKADVINESIKNIQKRVDGLGSKEIAIQSLGEDKILIQAPGFNDPESLRYAVGKTAKLTFHLLDETGNSFDVKLLKGVDGNSYRIIPKIEVYGTSINNAYNSVNQKGLNTVNFSLDKSGTEKFTQLTTANVGKRIAVVIDDEVITAPSIREPINTGNVEISGNFDFEGARNLASSLRAGALPVKLKIIEEKTVGATLGSILIKNGKVSLMISFAAVSLFMIFVYGMLGVVASLAILINIFMVISIMIMTHATLSLAGIAGLVLTIGMVVDSNVLIFERIKEELKKNNKAYVSGIAIGFDRAISTIIDSNVTTIIAAVLLLWFGDSNIKGFALTLTYGILISFFSSIFFTKIIIKNFQKRILDLSFFNKKFMTSDR
jgi:preprotein translocase subunit SecD